MKNIIYIVTFGLVFYWLSSTIWHFPMINTIFLLPLGICMLMVLFMMHNHTSEEGKKHNHH